MKKIILSAASLAVAAVASVSVVPTTAEAVPAFARQTGAACLNCHFGAIPRLAQMGREFRMNSFRDTSQELLEDDHLSLPAFFNASLLMKARIQENRNDAGLTELQWPDESALLFGGRVSENMGAFQEWDVIGGSMLGGKVAYVFDLDAGIVAIAAGTTDALGAPSIFNDPSNAITRNTRGIQSRSIALASQPMIHDGASGFGIYGFLADSVYFALGSVDGAGGYEAGSGRLDISKFGTYARVAWLGEIAGFDTIIGAFNATTVAGGVYGAGAATDAHVGVAAVAATPGIAADVTGLDIQLQGEVAGNQLGIYMPIVVSASNDITGFQLYANYNLTHAAGVQLGYDMVTDASGLTDIDTTRLIVGAWYDLAQNVAINYEWKTTEVGTAAAVAENTLELEYVY